MTAAPERRSQWFDLPTAARDWVGPGGRYAFHLSSEPMAHHDWLTARERLAEWDCLAGRMLRASMFDDGGDPRETRRLAEAVAATAEALAVALGEARI